MRRLVASYAPVVAVWALSRALLVAAPRWSGYPHHIAVTGDVRLYEQWAAGLAGGRFPVDDPSWQYPPVAGTVLLLPRLLAASHYTGALQVILLAADAVLLALLLRPARSGGSLAGAWTWVAGTTTLGPIVLNRFDLVPAVLVVAGLGTRSRPRLAGVLLGLGAVVKVWPALLLGAVRPLRPAVVAAGLVGVGVVLGLFVVGAIPEGLDFLGNQKARGLQIESLAATPYVLLRSAGVHGIRVVHEYGAYQVIGPGVRGAVAATTIATVLVVVAYAVAARRRPGDVALGLGALLAVVLVSRVLSPQYLIWELAVCAVLAANRPRATRLVGGLLVLAAGMTQLLYPVAYGGLLHGRPLPALLLAARNAVLVAACVAALRVRPLSGWGGDPRGNLHSPRPDP